MSTLQMLECRQRLDSYYQTHGIDKDVSKMTDAQVAQALRDVAVAQQEEEETRNRREYVGRLRKVGEANAKQVSECAWRTLQKAKRKQWKNNQEWERLWRLWRLIE
jgi:hypothetical protein